MVMNPDEFVQAVHAIGPFRNTADNSPLGNSLMVEFAFWAVVAAVTLALFAIRPGFLETVALAAKRLARRRMLSVVLVGLFALVLRAAVLPFIPIPSPKYLDEFSYILQAQTLASGRITNPTHPLWIHFETFHVNMQPTYESMYPPAQGAFMAIGELLANQPWWGIWLSFGLMCAAITWMLQGWNPPAWALLGGLFCAIRFGVFSYWINSYFGGTVPALGAALLMGALPRLVKKPTVACSLALAAGLALLANSRPYEGFVFALPAMLWLVLWHVRHRQWKPTVLKKALAPALAVMILCGAGMLYYNWRGTGNALLMPYMLNQRTYHVTKPFLWQERYPIPNYRHMEMRAFYCLHELRYYFRSRTAWGLRELANEKFRVYYEFFVWPLLLVFIPALWQMMKSRRWRLLPIMLLSTLAGLLVEAWPAQGHYAAPVLCVVVAVMLYGLRLLRTWRPFGRPIGLLLVRAIIMVAFAWTIFSMGEFALNPFQLSPLDHQLPPELERARLAAQLERTPGKQLVIVHLPYGHPAADDWVFNAPDIDSAKIVWARDMGPEENQELVLYFQTRRIWFVEQDDGIMRLTAYQEHSSEPTLAAAKNLPQQDARIEPQESHHHRGRAGGTHRRL